MCTKVNCIIICNINNEPLESGVYKRTYKYARVSNEE